MNHVSNHIPWRRPMTERDPRQPDRASTPLELFFDLCFVVAVAEVSRSMHHAIAAGHVTQGLVSYLMVFFAIWWAWMGFTWFASAYDPDDTPYRVAVLVQIAGVLVLAAGVHRAFDGHDFTVTAAGYTIMRLGHIANWLRAARRHPEGRGTALRYATGLAMVQAGWLLFVFSADPEGPLVLAFVALALVDLAVPVWAERTRPTAWHPGHVTERYGLFTIIVLGESVLSATTAVQRALRGEITGDLCAVAVGGLLTVFALWWIYFAKPYADYLTSSRAAFVWGYLHFVVFAAVAAVGSGLAVATEYATHEAHIGRTAAAASVTVPVAVFLIADWYLHVRPRGIAAWHSALLPCVAALVLAASWVPRAVLVTGLLLMALVAAGVTGSHREPAAPRA